MLSRFIGLIATTMAILSCGPRYGESEATTSRQGGPQLLNDSLKTLGFIGDSLTFGQVTDLVLDSIGDVYVLDALNGMLHGFGSDWHQKRKEA